MLKLRGLHIDRHLKFTFEFCELYNGLTNIPALLGYPRRCIYPKIHRWLRLGNQVSDLTKKFFFLNCYFVAKTYQRDHFRLNYAVGLRIPDNPWVVLGYLSLRRIDCPPVHVPRFPRCHDDL
ncbi:hypothetical protein NPIL_512491 [Nephila pilipes]|uniref:Uncharacterized protein n=1 Tax=Nephila pilipes TaxID=299642 RepID=A0A8X6QVM7_NEPPI|nr:hypothetical protein NPIL_512491 [Nephila pilipes]